MNDHEEEETKPTWAALLPPLPPPDTPGARAAELAGKIEQFLDGCRRGSARKSVIAKAVGGADDEVVKVLASSSRFERKGPGYWALRRNGKTSARAKPTGPRAAVLGELRQRLADLDREKARLENAIRVIEQLEAK